VSKRRTSKTKAEAVARDPVAESIANDEPTKEFPDGSVWFASNQRWFNQYIVEPSMTITGIDMSSREQAQKLTLKTWSV